MLSFLGLSALAADQGSKWLVRRYLPPGTSLPMGKWALTHVRNPGAAFGLGAGTPFLPLITGLCLLILLLFFLPRRQGLSPAGHYGLMLALAGTSGNLLDRLRWGYVTDFLDFHFWPVFNLADVWIVLGVALVGVNLWRSGTGGESQGEAPGGSS